MNIRAKIAVGIVGVALIVVPTSNYFAAQRQAASLTRGLEAKGRLITRLVATSAADAAVGGDYSFIQQITHQAVEDPDVLAAAFLDKHRRLQVFIDADAGDLSDARRGMEVNDSFIVDTIARSKTEVQLNPSNTAYLGHPVLDFAMPVDLQAGDQSRRFGLVRLFVSREAVDQAIDKAFTNTVIQSALLVFLGLAVSFFLAGRITRPIGLLVRDASGIAEGNLDKAITLPRSRDEVYKLATAFEEMRKSLIQQMEQVMLKERLEAELLTAKTIQMTLLPSEHPRIEGYDIAGACVMAGEIGGDYYDYVQFDEDGRRYLGLAIGDVNGHGVAAGLIMAVAKASLRTQIEVSGLPAAVLPMLNQVVLESARRKLLMTFFYGALDLEGRRLFFGNAGHNFPYLLFRDGRLGELEVGAKPLGFRSDVEYEQHCIDLEPGDTLLLYTDGAVEEENRRGTMYGYERFEALLDRVRDLPAAEIVETIIGEIRGWIGGELPEDDITIVAVKVL